MNRFRFFAKSLVHGAINWSGRSSRQRERLRGQLIILTYHSFCTNWLHGLFPSLPINRFEQQLRFLQTNFKLVSLQQGMGYLQQGHTDEKPWLAVTIDDGFQDNYTHAWPVLQRYGVPATIFVATDFVDSGRLPWPTQLVEILERTPSKKMVFPFKADIGDLVTRSTIVKQLKRELSSLRPEKRFMEIAALRRHLQVKDQARYPPLTWQQIREMRSSGISFGSHTVFHSILPVSDDDVCAAEIRDSKNRIEEELQEPCLSFAYPNGNHGVREKELLESEGYRIALTQDFGVNETKTDPFSLSRIEVPYHDPLSTFRARVSCCL